MSKNEKENDDKYVDIEGAIKMPPMIEPNDDDKKRAVSDKDFRDWVTKK